jgi:hypothetical protein
MVTSGTWAELNSDSAIFCFDEANMNSYEENEMRLRESSNF